MKVKLIYLSIIMFLLSTSCCTLYSGKRDLVILLPDIPPHWKQKFQTLTFSIEYPDSSGVKQTRELAGNSKSCNIQIPRFLNCPVIAQPVGDGFKLLPAGALFPQDLDKKYTDILYLSWDTGFTASLLLECYMKGCDISRLNGKRFTDLVLETSGEDPWELDFLKIGEHILSDNFSVNCLTLLPQRELCLYPGEGKWFFNSAFSPLFDFTGASGTNITNIREGFHRLFSLESNERYDIFAWEKEIIVVYYEGDLKL